MTSEGNGWTWERYELVWECRGGVLAGHGRVWGEGLKGQRKGLGANCSDIVAGGVWMQLGQAAARGHQRPIADHAGVVALGFRLRV